jgi:hypothetical protein
MWLPQLFKAFRKHNQYIYDVFITVNDDALDVLWMLMNSMINLVGWFSFKKQDSIATATAEVFDALLSLSELFL